MRLEGGKYRLTVDPAQGAWVTGAEWAHPKNGWVPLLAGQEGLPPFKSGCFVMAPFANRIADGRFGYAGKTYQLPLNSPDEGMATHGFARDRAWAVEDATLSSVRLVLDVEDDLPWSFRIEQRIGLFPKGIAISLRIVNTGAEVMPFGMGFHPWFPRANDTVVSFRAAGAHTKDARGLPLTERVPQPVFEQGLPVVDLGRFDGCLTGWAPHHARIDWPDRATALKLTAEGALRHLQMFSPDDRDVVCVEPVSHLPDSVNRPELGADAQMTALAPGEALAGAMLLSAVAT